MSQFCTFASPVDFGPNSHSVTFTEVIFGLGNPGGNIITVTIRAGLTENEAVRIADQLNVILASIET